MKILKRWKVLDPRTSHEREYELVILRTKSGEHRVSKMEEVLPGAIDVTHLLKGFLDARTCLSRARQFVGHLVSNGCSVSPLPRVPGSECDRVSR
ncbi:MAG: hypothetical protein HS116_25185 [Planctomycetes bacterium]|nr:hypothetical protein [Planctomycetota bacterium]